MDVSRNSLKRTLALGAAALSVSALVSVAAPSSAEAQFRPGYGPRYGVARGGYGPRYGVGQRYYGGGRYYGGRRGYGGGGVAAGVIGGLALGALAAGAYSQAAPSYGVYGGGYGCHIERQQVFDGYGYTWQRVRVCN